MIKWIIDEEIVDDKFCIGVLLINYMQSVFSWQLLQRKTITNTLHVGRREEGYWNNVGKKVISDIMSHKKRKSV